MTKKAVIFDLWNTLVSRTGPNLTTIISEYYALPYESVYEWIRLSSLAKDKSDRYYYLKMICQANSVIFRKEDKAFFDHIFDNYYRECEWIDGAQDLLIKIKKLGYKIGILSNSSEISYNIIDKFNIRPYVDDIVLSCEVGFLKPDPRIFQIILKNLNLEANEAIMVGDKITTDVLGAKIVGMEIIYFNKKEVESSYNPKISFLGITNQLVDIIEILKTES